MCLICMWIRSFIFGYKSSGNIYYFTFINLSISYLLSSYPLTFHLYFSFFIPISLDVHNKHEKKTKTKAKTSNKQSPLVPYHPALPMFEPPASTRVFKSHTNVRSKHVFRIRESKQTSGSDRTLATLIEGRGNRAYQILKTCVTIIDFPFCKSN